MTSSPEDTYDVLNVIGRGSFGEIRKVKRHRDGMLLCRKEIMWKRMKPREQEQLAAEIRILRDLQHKNIVQYVSETVDHETKMVYIYMEYCGNGDLYDLIQTRKGTSPIVRFSEHTVWHIFSQLAMALFRCHNGVDPPPLEDVTNPSTLGSAQTPQPRVGNIVLHRDIKPHNVFLDHNNRVKLGDFGLSKELRGQNLAETYVGTPFYMSPEIIAGRSYNAKSDIWALGCVIYEMCAFDPPFLARDQLDLNRKIKLGVVGSVTRFNYSDSLNAAIQSCLRQDEKVRPSAATLLKRPEMIMARQQLAYFDREELLLEKEASLIAREKEVEKAIQMKTEEFRFREDELTRREERLQRVEANQALALQDSTQRRLLEAERLLDGMARDKANLEQKLRELQNQPSARPHMTQTYHSDFLMRSHQETELPLPNIGLPNENLARLARPHIGRAQSELPHVNDDDPWHIKPMPSNTIRPDSGHRPSKSPQRRKSQVPMARVRAETSTRVPLLDHPTAVQGITRSMSKQELSNHSPGSENRRPNSAMGYADKEVLKGPRTPIKESSLSAIGSPRRMAHPSPTRRTVRTLFAENSTDIAQRPAPRPPGASRVETLRKAYATQDSRQSLLCRKEEDVDPSPYKKPHIYRTS